MRVLTDSSALAKLYLEEPGMDELDEVLAAADELALCVLCMPEVASALVRSRGEGRLTPAEYQLKLAELATDVRAATALGLNDDVIATAVRLLETNRLRASDALHVACALEWHAELFVTGDRRQAAAAVSAGLSVQFVGASS